jgi:hypothetical protein
MLFGDQCELALDQRAYLGAILRWRDGGGEASRKAFLGQPPQVSGRRFSRGNDLLRILVAQLVQRESAAPGDRQRLGQPRCRIDALERGERPQMTLAVRMERVARLRHGRLQPDGGQRILQRAATAGMHVNVAGGNERQPYRQSHFREIGATRRVVGVEQAFDGDPQRLSKARLEPARFVRVGNPARQPQRETAGDAVGKIGARQAIAALHCAAPAARDQRRQITVAFPIGRQQDQSQAVVEAKLAADDELQCAFFRFDVRPNDAGERAFVGDRQRRVAFLPGARNQLFRMRGAAQEAEVGNAV